MRWLICLLALVAIISTTTEAVFLPSHDVIMRYPNAALNADTKTYYDASLHNPQQFRQVARDAFDPNDIYSDCNPAQMVQFAQGYQNGASDPYDFSMCFPFFDPNLEFDLYNVYSTFGGALFQYILQNYPANITQVYHTVGVPPPFEITVDAPHCRLVVEINRNLSLFWPGEPMGVELNKASIQFKRLHHGSYPYNYNSNSPNNSPDISAVHIVELPNSEFMSKKMMRRFSMTADQLCTEYETHCSTLPGVDWADKEECLAYVQDLPFSTDPDGVINPAYGNTRTCRNYNMCWVVGGEVFNVPQEQLIARCRSVGPASNGMTNCANFF
jgi:hypothetical protein